MSVVHARPGVEYVALTQSWVRLSLRRCQGQVIHYSVVVMR